MGKFYVKFTHDGSSEEKKKAMVGASARAVAHEIRGQYRGVRILAIGVIGGGASRNCRRNG